MSGLYDFGDAVMNSCGLVPRVFCIAPSAAHQNIKRLEKEAKRKSKKFK